MKTGVAIGMLATAQFADAIEAGELSGSIVFHAAIGEETAEPGTKTLLEQGTTVIMVTCSNRPISEGTSEKGLAWYEIQVAGDPSHASRPGQGENAIVRARPILDAHEEYDETVRKRTDELVDQAYSTVTMFEAGTKENVIPELRRSRSIGGFCPRRTSRRLRQKSMRC